VTIDASLMRRQVVLLSAAQALFQTVSLLVMIVGGLAGAVVASSPSLATVPIAAMFLGTALCTVPASLWMARVGRRLGFMVGAVFGTLAGIVAAIGLWKGSLTILSLGTFLVGANQAFAQFYRFAAAEAADDAFRPRAISLVLAAGIVSAFLGPPIARYGEHLLSEVFAGTFLIASAVSAIAVIVLVQLRLPQQQVAQFDLAPRALGEIVRQPTYLAALFAAATGYGVMILAMTATPIAMVAHHHTAADASIVMQLHVLGMFLPSFFTGSLISRFGVSRVMLAGIAILALHVLATSLSVKFSSFGVALVMLGVGWNFLYVGGTTLLTSTYTPAERGRAQATNDLLIFVVAVVSSFSAAGLLEAFGWQTMNLLLLPWLSVCAITILVNAVRQRRAALSMA
jgi:MFS family permease